MTLRLVLPVICLALLACESAEIAAPEETFRPVKSIVVDARARAAVYTFSGTARADVEADISFKVGGTVRSRPVEVGEKVTAGQVLATLDPRDFNIRVREGEAQLANARAALRNAESNYARTRDLYENDNVARSELDNARAAAESAAAQVRIAEQSLANQRLQLSYTKVVSPAACDIADTFVKENENIASGQAVVRLNCGQCAEVRVSVPETVINNVQVGAPVSVSFAALPEREYTARVSEVGITMSGEANAFPVVAKLEEPCSEVRPGIAADVRFSFAGDDAAPKIIVPIVAVGEDREGRHVFVLSEDDDGLYRATKRAVVAGDPETGGLPVLSGLDSGERIVTAGVRRITDGQRVRLWQPAP